LTQGYPFTFPSQIPSCEHRGNLAEAKKDPELIHKLAEILKPEMGLLVVNEYRSLLKN